MLKDEVLKQYGVGSGRWIGVGYGNLMSGKVTRG